MKKIKSIICVMVVMFTMCFVGCGSSNSSKLAGDWVVESISMGEAATVKVEDALGLLGVESAEEFLVFNLNSDNTLVGKTMGVEVKGTWEEKGDTVTLIMDGASQEAKIEDGNLVMSLEGNKVILKKK